MRKFINTTYLPWALLGLFGLLAIFAFKNQANTSPEKDYMTLIISTDESGSHIRASISVNGEGYVREKLIGKENELKGPLDFNPGLRLLNEYQRGGWRVVSSNLVVNDRGTYEDKVFNYFLLERERNLVPKR